MNQQAQITLREGDARHLDWIPNESVHLVVTSPPYWTLKDYNDHADQLGYIADYERFQDELDKLGVTVSVPWSLEGDWSVSSATSAWPEGRTGVGTWSSPCTPTLPCDVGGLGMTT